MFVVHKCQWRKISTVRYAEKYAFAMIVCGNRTAYAVLSEWNDKASPVIDGLKSWDDVVEWCG